MQIGGRQELIVVFYHFLGASVFSNDQPDVHGWNKSNSQSRARPCAAATVAHLAYDAIENKVDGRGLITDHGNKADQYHVKNVVIPI